MRSKRTQVVGVVIGLIGILGFFEFLQPFLSSPARGFGDVVLVKLPFITSLCLLVSAYGMFGDKKWALKTAKAAFLLWICVGIAAVHFTWTFHPWGKLQFTDQLRGVSMPVLLGIGAAILLWITLQRLRE